MRGQFTLAYHFFQLKDARNHLELFLDTDGVSPLETWRCFRKEVHPPMKENRLTPQSLRFSAAPEHRRVYLTFEGNVSQNRGRLRILRRGAFLDKRRAAHAAHTLRVVL